MDTVPPTTTTDTFVARKPRPQASVEAQLLSVLSRASSSWAKGPGPGKFANPGDDAALSHSSSPLHALPYMPGGAVRDVARSRDESVVERDEAAELIMRAPSKADADKIKGAGEFPGTPTYAPSSAEGCAPRATAPTASAQPRSAAT